MGETSEKQNNEEQNNLEFMVEENKDELPFGENVKDIEKKARAKIREEWKAKKKALEYDKSLSKGLGNKYKAWEEKIYDKLFLVGVNKYEIDIEKNLKVYDEKVNKFHEIIENIRKDLKGEVKYTPIDEEKENSHSFSRRIKTIPEKDKGLLFKKNYYSDLIYISKRQAKHLRGKQEELVTKFKEIAKSELKEDLSEEKEIKKAKIKNQLNSVSKDLDDTKKYWQQYINQFKYVDDAVQKKTFMIEQYDNYIETTENNRNYLTTCLRDTRSIKNFWSLYEGTYYLDEKNNQTNGLINIQNKYTTEILDKTMNVQTRDMFIEPEPTIEEIEKYYERNKSSLDDLIQETTQLGL